MLDLLRAAEDHDPQLKLPFELGDFCVAMEQGKRPDKTVVSAESTTAALY